MGELCALWRLIMRLLVSGRIPDRHATLTFTRSHKGSDIILYQTNSWRWYCFSFCCWFDITCIALQYPCSLNVPIRELSRMAICLLRYDRRREK
jgi:hypothetical protein